MPQPYIVLTLQGWWFHHSPGQLVPIPDLSLNFSTFKFISKDGVLVKVGYNIACHYSRLFTYLLSVHFLHNSFAIPVLPYPPWFCPCTLSTRLWKYLVGKTGSWGRVTSPSITQQLLTSGGACCLSAKFKRAGFFAAINHLKSLLDFSEIFLFNHRYAEKWINWKHGMLEKMHQRLPSQISFDNYNVGSNFL